MDSNFFSFDEAPRLAPPVGKREYIQDPRDTGGVLLESRIIERAKCSICDCDLSMEIFYFSGKTRKFIKCNGCKKYLFELERKPKY
ncbi:hypothetical protein GF325_10750 [Candidatus Bathyarchaeota archaeon]|nr:hypothetical protein [Candidatus Bathyarchaeota archaeon]